MLRVVPIDKNFRHVDPFKPPCLDSPSRISTQDASMIISPNFIDSIPRNMTICVVAPRNKRRLNSFLIKIRCGKWRSSIMIEFEFCLVSTYRFYLT